MIAASKGGLLLPESTVQYAIPCTSRYPIIFPLILLNAMYTSATQRTVKIPVPTTVLVCTISKSMSKNW